MSKTLKLTGIQTYVGVATKNEVIKKGDVCTFDDDIAKKLLEGSRTNSENEPVSFFTETTDEVSNYNFSSTPVGVSADKDEDEGTDENEDADAPATAARKQRRTGK